MLPKCTLEPLAARNLIAATLGPILAKNDTDKTGFQPGITSREIGDVPVVAITRGTDALVLYAPYGKLKSLEGLLGTQHLIEKLMSDKGVDQHLARVVARVKLTLAQPKRPASIEIVNWFASARSVVALRRARGSLPPGMSVTFAKPVLEAA